MLAAYPFLFSLLDDLDNRKKALGLYCDFSKAFDNINHSIFLDKFNSVEVRGSAQKRIKCNLENRHQYISINDRHEGRIYIGQ